MGPRRVGFTRVAKCQGVRGVEGARRGRGGSRVPAFSRPWWPQEEDHMKATSRFSIAFLLAVATFGTTVWALADAPKADRQCDGEHGGKGKGAKFQKADKKIGRASCREKV